MDWHRWAVFGGVVLLTLVIARVVDARMARKDLPPDQITRYRVLRRSVLAGILALGLLSAALAIPQVRAVAGAFLGSAVVLGLIFGLASQSVLANFVAGVLLAFTQPLRIGDRVEVGGREGVVEEIGLVYSFIRLDDDSRLVIPNSTLSSDTIRNSTIVSREKVAEILVQLPLGSDLPRALDLLREEVAGKADADVYLASLEGSASIAVRAGAPDAASARTLERDLRLRAHERLRGAGVIGSNAR